MQHVVVQLVPEAAAKWSGDEVASRWLRLFCVGGRIKTPLSVQKRSPETSSESKCFGNA